MFLIKKGGQSPPFFYFIQKGLYCEGSAAATGFAGIGIAESESAAVESALPVHLHSVQVQLVTLVHDAGNASEFK